MDHFLFNTPRLLVGTKSDLRSNRKRISELNANGQQLITVEQVSHYVLHSINLDINNAFPFFFHVYRLKIWQKKLIRDTLNAAQNKIVIFPKLFIQRQTQLQIVKE